MKLFVTICVAVVLLVIGDAPKPSDSFQGSWMLVSGEADGKLLSESQLKPNSLTIDGDRYTILLPGKDVVTGVQKLDTTKQPKTIDIMDASGSFQGKTCLGIYEFDGDDFRVAFAQPGQPRPTTFTTTPGTGEWMHVWTRVPE